MPLSIVIPTLNESRYLPAAVAAARSGAMLGEPEIVVADCGSADGTAALARRLGVEVVEDPRLDSRAAAAGAGASRARGATLLFLDADSLLPAGYDAAIRDALARPGVVAGAFELRFDEPGRRFRGLEALNRARYRLNRLYYGDQGLFVTAEAFRRVGGFPPMKILETAELCRRLKRVGELALVPEPIVTSARRFVEGGFWRVLGADTRIWFRYFLGRPVDSCGESYWRENARRGRLTPRPGSPSGPPAPRPARRPAPPGG